jgi:4-amino-4-deoxy-L-arabinose transferase-like glycosyltransferase
MFGPTTGFLGGMILATSGMFISLSRSVVHDISLVFFMTLALYFFYLGYTSIAGRKTYFLLFYGSLGFAVLAKGPLGVVGEFSSF